MISHLVWREIEINFFYLLFIYQFLNQFLPCIHVKLLSESCCSKGMENKVIIRFFFLRISKTKLHRGEILFNVLKLVIAMLVNWRIFPHDILARYFETTFHVIVYCQKFHAIAYGQKSLVNGSEYQRRKKLEVSTCQVQHLCLTFSIYIFV